MDSGSTKGRWSRRLWMGGIGLLVLLVVTVVTAALAFLGSWSSMSRRGDPAAEPATRAVSLPLSPAAAGSTGAVSGIPATHLEIDLQGGMFRILPAPAGTDIRVEGTYASNYYALEEERRPVGELGAEVVIRFRPTASVFTRLLAGLQNFSRDHPNQLTVYIPRDHPIALTLRVAEGQSETELGGLDLTALDIGISKGSHEVSIDAPLARDLEHVNLTARMGEMRVSGLGNARFRELTTVSSMGACRIDLGGAWSPGTRRSAHLSHRMGELTVLVPEGVRVTDSSSNTALLGGSSTVGRRGPPADPDAPSLDLTTRTVMGGLTVRHR